MVVATAGVGLAAAVTGAVEEAVAGACAGVVIAFCFELTLALALAPAAAVDMRDTGPPPVLPAAGVLGDCFLEEKKPKIPEMPVFEGWDPAAVALASPVAAAKGFFAADCGTELGAAALGAGTAAVVGFVAGAEAAPVVVAFVADTIDFTNPAGGTAEAPVLVALAGAAVALLVLLVAAVFPPAAAALFSRSSFFF
jgi:hypothetical protein